MKLVMTLLVRNEVDVIQANLEYHLAQGVDFVIVTDHGSEDGTSEILREYERIGVATVIRDEEEGHHQSNRVTRMAELARVVHNADWVIHNDADEFWWPLVGDLRDVFSSLSSRFGQIEVQRRNFRPRADGGGPFYSRLVYREVSSLTPSGFRLESKVAHRPHPGVVVVPGNHSIRGGGLATVPAEEVLEIFHFPMRSYEQFEHKVVQIGHGYEQIPDRSPSVGGDQMALLELQRAGKLRDYYEGLVLEEAALERGLQMGTIVVDRRLEDFMRDLRSGERFGMRPDAPFAGAMLRRMMNALDDSAQDRHKLEESHEELVRLRSENRREREHGEQLRGQVNELSADLERYTSKLQSTDQALHLLRSSRLMRSTAMVRRWYYRAAGKGSSKRAIPRPDPLSPSNMLVPVSASRQDLNSDLAHEAPRPFELNAPYAPSPDNRPALLEYSPLAFTREADSQMSFGERAALEGILAQLRPRLAIEIGTAEGGSLARIASYSEEVHSIDLTHEPMVVAQQDHVVLHTGSSQQLLPELLAGFAAAGRAVDFALVDGDHSYDGVANDLRALLESSTTSRSVILLHDSMNEEVRAGIESVGLDDYEKIVYYELDFVPGYIYRKGLARHAVWGGFGLILCDSQRSSTYSPSPRQWRYYEPYEAIHRMRAELRASDATREAWGAS